MNYKEFVYKANKKIVFFTKSLDIGVIDKEQNVEEYFSSSIDTDIHLHKKFTSKLSKLMINMTDDCNLRCTYCYASKYIKKESISKEVLDAIIDKLIGHEQIRYVDKIVFFGGEPLLNIEGIEYLIEEVNKLYCSNRITQLPKYSMITNGTIYNKSVKHLLNKYNIGVLVSIDGPKEIQDKQRPFINGEGSYSIVSKNIKMMQKDGFNVNYESTITKLTLEKGFDETVLRKYFKSNLNLDNGVLVPENFVSDDKYFNYNLFSRKGNRYIAALNELNFNDENFEIPFRLLTKQPMTFPCGLGRNIFHILADGTMYPCQLISGMEEYAIANVRDFDVSLMLDNNYIRKNRE